MWTNLPISLVMRPNLILSSSNGKILDHALHFKFGASKNQAKYEGVIAGVKLIQHIKATKIAIFSDINLW